MNATVNLFLQRYQDAVRDRNRANALKGARKILEHAPIFSFEEWFHIWEDGAYNDLNPEHITAGDFNTLRAFAIDKALELAKDSISQLLLVAKTNDRDRTRVTKRVAELLLIHFGEKERIVASDMGTYEIITITRFLFQTGHMK